MGVVTGRQWLNRAGGALLPGSPGKPLVEAGSPVVPSTPSMTGRIVRWLRRRSERRASIAPSGQMVLSEAMLSVAAFHRAFDLPRRARPSTDVSADLAMLRVALLEEEITEFTVATNARDIIELADALADIVYVTYGAALTYGIDLDAVVREVHRSNMSKLDRHGRPVLRADGKVIKSDRYRPPDLAPVLLRQAALPV